ncbi:dof zinc finger protein DOF5.4-like [Punica granatum]|uniref:Dof zinc finger protein n=2 Tax=Punica granatum TaxID=22663 RepID=A0A218VYP7_PUNGR|nr:dof zinc finger protein DOF5.4-like [Punica granatum]OWM65200.1 hypothetical protein CDL15_Pgr008789 [Punica granatum]PKI31452.1 hypothetical protein CRG98_048165 [Punica granatum]
MQDIHSIAGGRIFGGGGGGGAGDRRLRPHHHHPQSSHLHQQALKCPRCDSLNTKFCYYNNYNLSQPRHFCKNCRRYWTKGGVLRNVPVGGGCRKTKRSKPKPSASAEPATAMAEAVTTTTSAAPHAMDLKTSSHSSSESSSLTATTTAAAAEAVSATSSVSPSSFFNIHDYKSIIEQTMNPPAPGSHGFDQGLLEQSSGCGLFSEIGNFSSLITSAAEPLLFGFGGVVDQSNQWSSSQQAQDQEQKLQQGAGEIPSSDGSGPFLDQTVQVDLPGLPGKPSGNEAFGPLDWQPAADQGLFDITCGVDQAYWGQNAQWADEDHQHGLYLP